MSGHAETIRNHLLWKKALSEHDATLHRQLVADGVPWPSADDALAALDALLAENQRLREALEWYADSPASEIRRRAVDALAGDTE